MAKILIAGIGGGKAKSDGHELKRYREANYEIEGKQYPNTPFITSALEKHYKIDKTVYIGTVGSMWDNLYSYYCKKFDVKEDQEYTFKLLETIDEATNNLKISIENLDLTKFNKTFEGKVEGRVTKYGMNDSEIFDNFNIIMNLSDVLKDGDEVYIDITHSFRSNAMWMFLILNFINDVMDTNIVIKSISYGMLEVSGANGGVTPVINLLAFYKLMKWIKGANALKNYGNSYDLLDILPDEDVKKKMNNFSEAININYLGSIKQSLESLKRIIDKIDSIEGPGKFLIPDIVKKFIKEFDGLKEDYMIQARLAKWYYKQKRYAMAYINLNESIKGYVEKELESFIFTKSDEDNIGNYSRKSREFFYKIYKINRNSKNYKKANWIEKSYPEVWEIYTMYDHSRRVRNDIAHAIGEKDSTLNDINSLRRYCEKIEDILSRDGVIRKAEETLNFLKC